MLKTYLSMQQGMSDEGLDKKQLNLPSTASGQGGVDMSFAPRTRTTRAQASVRPTFIAHMAQESISRC